jgi:hypothetical protein
MKDFLLIDIARLRLVQVQSGQQRRYVALSYVWGNVRMLQTTRANFQSLQRDGSLERAFDEVPTVIHDAIKLTNKLGIRYLWADCLCIVQDDGASKHIQLAQMDRIYREAVLTIAALAGQDANCPLPGVRPKSRETVVDEAGGLHLAIYQPHLTGSLGRSVYATRGWTFQESVLSRRVLFVSKFQMHFRCNHGTESEIARVEMFKQDTTDLNPLALIDQAIMESTHQLTWGNVMAAYASLVENYMCRNLSYPEDILNAFAGLSSYFERVCGGSCLYGMPTAFFGFGLLWSARGTIHRRETLIPDGHGAGVQTPSWAWAGWNGRIEHQTTSMSHFPIELVSLTSAEIKLGYRNHERCVGEKACLSTHECCPTSATEPSILTARTDQTSADETNHGTRESRPKVYAHPTLIFTAYTVPASRFRFQIRRESTIPNDADYHLSRMNAQDYDYNAKILDEHGHHCGIFIGDIEHLPFETSDSTDFQQGGDASWDFVVISALKRTPRSAFVWITYFNYFDEEVFGPEKDLDCCNVLLIKWKGEQAERFAAARMHLAALSNAEPILKSIQLI